jgi:hypothetical protein
MLISLSFIGVDCFGVIAFSNIKLGGVDIGNAIERGY